MSRICEHTFRNGGEYDLYAKLDMTIAKTEEAYIIKKISNDEVVYSFPLRYANALLSIVQIANDLEGAKNTWVECDNFCPVICPKCKKEVNIGEKCCLGVATRIYTWKVVEGT